MNQEQMEEWYSQCKSCDRVDEFVKTLIPEICEIKRNLLAVQNALDLMHKSIEYAKDSVNGNNNSEVS